MTGLAIIAAFSFAAYALLKGDIALSVIVALIAAASIIDMVGR